MSIPLATTTISVLRSTQDGTNDLRDLPTYATLATGIRAHIGGPGGAEVVSGGSREDVTFRLDADPCDLRHFDRVLDEATAETYEVVWVKQRRGLGLDHTVADLRQTTDRVSI